MLDGVLSVTHWTSLSKLRLLPVIEVRCNAFAAAEKTTLVLAGSRPAAASSSTTSSTNSTSSTSSTSTTTSTSYDQILDFLLFSEYDQIFGFPAVL